MIDDRKTMMIKDLKINYYTAGTGECLFFLHGNGMNSLQFKKMYERLKKNYKVVAMDVRGSGLTTRGTKNINFNTIVEDILMFFKELGIEKATFIGYSDGANISMIMAKKHPELVKRLILICGNYNNGGIVFWFKIILKILDVSLRLISKFSKLAYLRLELLYLIFEDMHLSINDLKNFTMDTLVVYSGIDVVKKRHTLEIANSIKNSTLAFILCSTHGNIEKTTKCVDIVEDYLLNKID